MQQDIKNPHPNIKWGQIIRDIPQEVLEYETQRRKNQEAYKADKITYFTQRKKKGRN